MVEGVTKQADGTEKYQVYGKFTEYIKIRKCGNECEGEEVWRIREKPEKSELVYQFSNFTLQLNYLTEELRKVLPHTDSRLRPDQRAFENGDFQTATTIKN